MACFLTMDWSPMMMPERSKWYPPRLPLRWRYPCSCGISTDSCNSLLYACADMICVGVFYQKDATSFGTWKSLGVVSGWLVHKQLDKM